MKKSKYKKLPPLFKKKWLRALRSGEFKQGQGRLRNRDNTYCCLGVACKVVEIGNDKLHGHGIPDSRNHDRLPKVLLEKESAIISHLINMNDEKHNKFTIIANWIEKNL